MTRLARPAAWAALLLLALLSLLPKDQMIRTGAAGWSEHLVAYFGAMLLFAMGYGDRIGVKRLAVGLVVYAGVLELGQHLAPGRLPALLDFLAGAAGAVTAALAYQYLRDRRKRPFGDGSKP